MLDGAFIFIGQSFKLLAHVDRAFAERRTVLNELHSAELGVDAFAKLVVLSPR